MEDTVRHQLKKKLATILINPRIDANHLHVFSDCYKIKLRSSGYRLVYQVIDQEAWGLWWQLISASGGWFIAKRLS